MELLAQGRDCDIFDLGDGTVLRRSRSLYDQTLETKVIAYAAEHGYPVPTVHELRDDGKDLVMEKVEGPTMLQAIEKKPWKIGEYGRLLGDLHRQLHELPGPDFVPKVEGGDRFLHFDLHPLNVILSPDGPVVIDWTNACSGPPGTDIARAWALMASAEGAVGFPLSIVLGSARKWLVRSFVDRAGREEARAGLRYGVELTLLDPNISEVEKDRMRALAEAEGV
jgi:aminoglycoside phosphotransferase (APT) family kinase protein